MAETTIPIYDIGPGTPEYDNAVKYMVKVLDAAGDTTGYYFYYSLRQPLTKYILDVVIGKYNGNLGKFRSAEIIPDNLKIYFTTEANSCGFRCEKTEYDCHPEKYKLIDNIMPTWFGDHKKPTWIKVGEEHIITENICSEEGVL